MVCHLSCAAILDVARIMPGCRGLLAQPCVSASDLLSLGQQLDGGTAGVDARQDLPMQKLRQPSVPAGLHQRDAGGAVRHQWQGHCNVGSSSTPAALPTHVPAASSLHAHRV